MVTCELCGKQVKTAQALRGHKTFIHGITGSNTQQPVSKLEERLSKLEYVTGLRESDLDFSLSDTEPLTDRLTNITEQVSKLGDAVSKLDEDLEIAKTTSNELANRFDADEGVITRLTDKVELERQSLLKIIETVDKNAEVDNRRFGRLHTCPDCGASLHLHRTSTRVSSESGKFVVEGGSWHLECVLCGYYSPDYKATVWKEKAGNHPIPVKKSVEEPEKPKAKSTKFAYVKSLGTFVEVKET